MDDEPLEAWAERRDRQRPALGERQAAPLGDQTQGAHVDPIAARGIQEWDGHQWVPAGVSEGLAAAAQEVGDAPSLRAERVPLPGSSKLPKMPAPFRPTVPFYRP
ncbi:DUF6087 family protein [[Kitasatospora] papulosa]|uniref:DUF6087 family protein n=1 Tax=[Kitasatospora] papulosa TaxID=1464011 RepID=UPI0039084404